jgi:hypothetical protein
MVVNKIKKAIEDSKRKKQFRLRAKDRGERRIKKEKGLHSKFVDKRSFIEQKR